MPQLPQAAPKPEPLAVRDIAALRSFGYSGRAAALSPDGKLAAVTVLVPATEGIEAEAEYYFTATGVEWV